MSSNNVGLSKKSRKQRAFKRIPICMKKMHYSDPEIDVPVVDVPVVSVFWNRTFLWY